MSFIKDYVERVKAPTPKFFKKLIKFGTSLATLGAALCTVPNIPLAISDKCSTLVWVGGAIVAVAIAARENVLPDAEQVNNNQNNQV